MKKLYNYGTAESLFLSLTWLQNEVSITTGCRLIVSIPALRVITEELLGHLIA